MSSENLERAISLIQSGDKEGGRNLLIDVVNSEPKNEDAWLWLSSVVPLDKRAFCLEKVLEINPNNIQAKQFMDTISSTPQIQIDPTPQPTHSDQESTSTSPQYWAIPVGKEVRVVYLDTQTLTMFDVVPKRIPLVLDQIKRGAVTKDWYSENIALGFQDTTFKSVPINKVIQVRLLIKRITVDYRDDDGKDTSISIRSDKDEVIESILAGLQNRLGNSFTRISRPNSRVEVAIRSLILLVFGLGGTGFCYWATLDLVGRELHGRYSGIASLFQLIGPNGVLCIGGGLILLLLVFIISQFVKPPTETLLVRKDSSME